MTTPSGPKVLTTRELNRATLARQLLLDRAPMTAHDAVAHLLGLQAQNQKPPYYSLAARLADFDPMELSGLLESRAAVRIVAMRSTVHLLTADDTPVLRQLGQPALERELKNFLPGLPGVDLDRLAALARAFVEEEPRTGQQIGTELRAHWPDADPLALRIAARARLALVQVPPRGLWGRSGQATLTTVESWLGRPLEEEADFAPVVLRYLAAFGPASVKDMQLWCGRTRLRAVFDRLRPQLRALRGPDGVELYDVPDAPLPDPDTPAPPRFLPEYDNLVLSHADRTRVVPAEYRGRTWQGNSNHCVFLVDGFLRGIWRIEEGDGAATMVVEPFAALSRSELADVEREAAGVLEMTASGAAHDVRVGAVR
ncbi:winged helix DNA-binding domain-containing protein [Streptomyces sp. NPDC051940]|uniref:winged helix DNA-binding domain-containing protein n=1 Tax=Streptomyces sp. NPDC051940 TaxID=3155675 RepID=UPI00343C21F3